VSKTLGISQQVLSKNPAGLSDNRDAVFFIKISVPFPSDNKYSSNHSRQIIEVKKWNDTL
jgi:hypothetical protein